jgi:hypothetical protein
MKLLEYGGKVRWLAVAALGAGLGWADTPLAFPLGLLLGMTWPRGRGRKVRGEFLAGCDVSLWGERPAYLVPFLGEGL